MGIFDIFRRKKAEQVAPTRETAVAPPAETLVAKSSVVAGKPTGSPAGRAGRQLLVRPLLSEKSTHLAGSGQYVFVVTGQANKPEIKKDIERIYNVHVESVNVINMPGKKRRYGRSQGETSEWRKAVVKLRAGEKIPGILEAVG